MNTALQAGLRRCDLCDHDDLQTLDVRVPARESIKSQCWPCLVGLARSVDYEVQVAAKVLKVLPPLPGSSKPRLGGITHRYAKITGNQILGTAASPQTVNLDEVVRRVLGDLRDGE